MSADRRFPLPAHREAWEAFPRAHARTRQFTLGEPRAVTVAPDGARVAFLRSPSAEDPVGALWVHDLPQGTERVVVDPRAHGSDEGELAPEERARRERVRESAGGITAYATDQAVRTAVCVWGGQLLLANLVDASVTGIDVGEGAVVDPRLSPDGAHVAFARDGALFVCDLESGALTRLTPNEPEGVTWGLAEFAAAEEMARTRGFWWAPDSRSLAVARVDERPVATWYVSDPTAPEQPPTTLRYPAAGTPNAEVSMAVLGLDGERVDLRWDREALCYLAHVCWTDHGLHLTVQPRDQRRVVLLAADPATGATDPVFEQTDDDWVDLLPGVPQVLAGGRVLHVTDDASGPHGTRRLALDGRPLTPEGVQVRSVVDVDEHDALITGSDADPTAIGVWRVPLDGSDPVAVTPADGVHSVTACGAVVVTSRRALDQVGTSHQVAHPDGTSMIVSRAGAPSLTPAPRWLQLGPQDLRAALLLPTGWTSEDGPLPVLLDPYGGPHAQRVLRASAAHTTSQWFADAGYAVLVVDGRGSPGRGPIWERAIAGDLATAPLEDQLIALEAAAEALPDTLDLDRVGIRGWSFGGYLAALAALRRPDVVHAAIAGAPVTAWSLYDTHYTERYLGYPDVEPEAYARSSLLDDAPGLTRPLLLIHGLSDDNVVAGHTLRLSHALLEAGRPHQVLPLVGVTHMTPQEAVAESLLRLQLDFLDRTVRDLP